MCCAFNMKKTLKQSNYSDLVKKMRKVDNTILNRGIEKEGSQKMVKIGKRNGLRLVMDQHSNKVSYGTVSQDYNGFQVFIGTPGEFPVMKDRSILVQPGYENFIEVSGYVVGSSPDVQKLEPADRKCFFSEEGGLDFYDKYSYSSCKFECSIAHVERQVGCVPWYIPHGGSSSICQPWDALQFSKLLGEVTVDNCTHTCLPDCQAVIYSFSHSSAPFR